jgi:predicted small lipoprotein YifL
VLAATFGALAGCGQQGPLYLPDAAMPHGKAVKAKGETPALPPASATPDQSERISPVTPSIPD